MPTFSIIFAQDCPADYATLLQELSEICNPAVPGIACTSGSGISLEFADGTHLTPDTPLSDIRLDDLHTLVLEDEESLALLRMPHPLIKDQAMTLLALGALELDNQVIPAEEAQPVTLNVKILNGINVRETPSTQSKIIDGLAGGDEVTADGRNANGSWLRIILEDGRIGWVAAPLVQLDGDVMTLVNYEVNLGTSVQRSPMQAFHLTSSSTCGESGSGVLVQIPKAWGALEMVINEIPVSLRGTAFIQASTEELKVFMLDGLGWTSAAGSGITVPMGTGLHVTTAAETLSAVLEPYPLDALSLLPLDSLEEAVALPAPLTQEEIDVQLDGLLPERGQWKWVWDTSLFEGDCPFLPFFMLPNFGFLPSFDGSRLRLALYMNGRQSAGPWIERTVPSIYSGAENLVGNGMGEIAFYILSPTFIEWEMANRMADGESVCIWRGHYQFIPE